MKTRIVIAGLLGGFVLFNWGYVAHMVLPLGTMGMQSLASEDQVSQAIRSSMSEPGLYLLPGMDFSRKQTPESEKAYAEKLKKGPVGLMIVNPRGSEVNLPRRMAVELGTNVLAALVAAALLAQVRNGFAERVIFVTALGLLAWVIVCVPNWNWYAYPIEFTLARGIEFLVGWLLVGFVLAAIVKPAPAYPAAVAPSL